MYRTYKRFVSLLTILGVLAVLPTASGLTTAYHGRENGDWGNHANWTNGVPGSKDTAIINAYPAHPLDAGLYPDINDLAEIHINDGYAAPIGTDCAPLTLSADVVYHAGKAALHYFNLNAEPGRRIIVDSDSKHTALRLDGKWVAQVEVIGGGLILADTQGGIGHLTVTRGRRGPDNAMATIAYAPDRNVEQLTVTAGQVWIAAPVTNCLQTGGEIRFKGPGAEIRYLEIAGRGAIFKHRCAQIHGLDTVHVVAGTFDAQGGNPDHPYRVRRLLTWPTSAVLGTKTLAAKRWIRIGMANDE